MDRRLKFRPVLVPVDAYNKQPVSSRGKDVAERLVDSRGSPESRIDAARAPFERNDQGFTDQVTCRVRNFDEHADVPAGADDGRRNRERDDGRVSWDDVTNEAGRINNQTFNIRRKNDPYSNICRRSASLIRHGQTQRSLFILKEQTTTRRSQKLRLHDKPGRRRFFTERTIARPRRDSRLGPGQRGDEKTKQQSYEVMAHSSGGLIPGGPGSE